MYNNYYNKGNVTNMHVVVRIMNKELNLIAKNPAQDNT